MSTRRFRSPLTAPLRKREAELLADLKAVQAAIKRVNKLG